MEEKNEKKTKMILDVKKNGKGKRMIGKNGKDKKNDLEFRPSLNFFTFKFYPRAQR